jgi:hypothetical protein
MTSAVAAAFVALVVLLVLGANAYISAASAAVVGLSWAYVRSNPKDTP